MARMPPRKAAQVQPQSKESAATTTRGRATAEARATRSTPTKKERSPLVSQSRPGPLSRKKRGGASPSPEKGADKKKDEDKKAVPLSPIIKQSPTKKTVRPPPVQDQEAAEEEIRKQKRHDVTSDDDDDDEERPIITKSIRSSSPKHVQKSKSKPSASPRASLKSKPSDISASEDDEHEGHEDVDAHTDTRGSKQTKTKDEELNEGMNVFALMDSKEIEELLDRIDKQCSPTDNYSVRKRENAIEWEQVAFSSYGESECRAAWIYLKHHTRSYRIMYEVVNEVKYKFVSDKTFQTRLIESLPGFPQKPPNALGGFHCFNREQWVKKKDDAALAELDTPNFVKFQRECRVQFEALPNHIKEKYNQQAELAKAEYKRQVKQFYAENPGVAQHLSKLKVADRPSRSHAKVRKQRQRNPSSGSGTLRTVKSEWIDPYEDAPQPPHATPVATFMQAKLNSIEPPPTQEQLPELKQGIYEKWKTLSDRKRAKWIGYCVELCVAYMENSREYQSSHPGYDIPPLKVKQLIPAEDMAIWESTNGKPGNHSQTSQDMFVDEFLQSEENAELSQDQRRAIAQTKWSEMPKFEKEMFTMQFKVSQLQYRNNLQKFYAKVPPFMKEICLKKIPKKYWKALEEVDKVPSKSVPSEAASEVLITAEGGVVYNDDVDDQTDKKQKKSKKRRREKTEEEEVSEVNQVNSGGDLEFQHEEYLEEDEDPIPKKKKKRKKHAEHDESELNYANYQGDEDEFPLQGGEYSAAYRAKKTAKVHKEEMMRAGDHAAVTLEEDFVDKHKHSSKYFPENNIITKNDIYESIRGIFDARALGRKFSVYYYYAKYVASERIWIDSVNSSSLSKTAIDIIRTFLSLAGVQQDIFLQQSYAYHEAKRHTPNFPNEPKPPSKLAKNLFRKAVTQKKKRDPSFVAPTWTELSDTGQLYYTKQLYHETKLYMRRYDAFISSLTPSDFVDYAIHKYRIWEANLYTKQSLTRAFRSFTFPISSEANVKDEIGIRGVDGELNLIGTELPYTPDEARSIHNPFITNTAVDTILKKRQSTSSQQTWAPKSVDSSGSDNEDIEFSLLLDKDMFRRKVKKAEMYDYPLDDILAEIYPNPNNTPSMDKRMKWISEGTQTNRNVDVGTLLLEFVSVGTQTHVNDYIVNII